MVFYAEFFDWTKFFTATVEFSRLNSHDWKENLGKIFWIPSLTEEAIAKYGKENIKVYQTTMTGMFHALTEHKSKTIAKLICLGEEEKVGYFEKVSCWVTVVFTRLSATIDWAPPPNERRTNYL